MPDYTPMYHAGTPDTQWVCNGCGTLVWNKSAHDKFHEELRRCRASSKFNDIIG